MNAFITVIGWLAIIIVLIAICGVAVVGAVSACERAMHWMYCKAYDKAVHDIARHIRSSAHWFGEDYNTSKCLKLLAEHMQSDMASYAAPEKWRQAWRDACSKFKETGVAP